MKLTVLEARENAAVVAYNAGLLTLPAGQSVPALSGFPGPGGVDTDGDLVAVGAGRGGGPAVQVFDAGGALLASFFAFDPSFRGGVDVAIDAGGIRVAPAVGSGGGPILRTFDRAGALLSSAVVGDPDNRDGVAIGAGDPNNEAVPGVPLDLSRLGVRLLGPGDPTAQQWGAVRQSLAVVPAGLSRDLIAAGVTIDVVTGPLTDRPGVVPPAGGDNGGVYVPPARAVVYRLGSEAGSVDTLRHEIGHAADLAVLGGASGVGDWLYVWSSTAWPTEYERTRPEEAWAESFARALGGEPQPAPAVSDYFAGLFSARGW